MNQDNPLLLIVVTLGMGILFVMWWRDYQASRRGQSNPQAFPGAVPGSGRVLAIALTGTAVLLGIEVAGEYALGVADEQTTMTALAALYSLAAGFGEELVFRGYLVVTRRGKVVLAASIVGFSLLFALAHPYLWEWDGGLRFTPGPKAWFTTAMLFVGSVWFYALRFLPSNPGRSLVPCIVAHVGKNAGVVAIKASQGFLSGWW